MKRYTKTFWNGMLEYPKGIWVKEKDACDYLDSWIQKTKRLNDQIEDHQKEWRELHNKYSNKRIKVLLITTALLISLLGNIGQLIYHLN